MSEKETQEVDRSRMVKGMRRNNIREKKILCGDSYMAVGLYAITPQEHKARGKKQKESSTDQKSRNKMSSLRQKQRKAIANFDKYGFFLTGTFEEEFLPDDILACKREVVNYKRRVIAATCKRFGVSRDKIRVMLWAVRKGEAGRLHMTLPGMEKTMQDALYGEHPMDATEYAKEVAKAAKAQAQRRVKDLHDDAQTGGANDVTGGIDDSKTDIYMDALRAVGKKK